jgi:hypothetical protein
MDSNILEYKIYYNLMYYKYKKYKIKYKNLLNQLRGGLIVMIQLYY